MISSWVTKTLIYIYLLLAFICLLEKDMPRFRYWLGATLLTWGVLTMK